MGQKVVNTIVLTVLILGGTLFYFSSQKTTLFNQTANQQNVVPTQKLSFGSDVKIVGTVVENITKYAPVGGPAYLNVRTDDGAQMRVTYNPGEAECRNMEMASTGFSVKTGARVEVFAKAIYEKELFTCDSNAYYIKTITKTDQQNSGNNQVQELSSTPVSTPTPSITVLSPNGGERWFIGKTYNIEWSLQDYGLHENKPVDIDLMGLVVPPQPGANPIPVVQSIIARSVKSEGSYKWTIPSERPARDYLIRVRSAISNEENISDYSDNIFTIERTTPSITVLSPTNAGEKWIRNSTQMIRWETTFPSFQVEIDLYSIDAHQTFLITKGVPASQKSYNWTVGQVTRGHCITFWLMFCILRESNL